MNYYFSALRKYAIFKGRATRREYWSFVLFSFIVGLLLFIISSIVGDTNSVILRVYYLLIFIPTLAVLTRRMHDINESGWVLALLIIPVVGQIWIFIYSLLKGKSDENKYGLGVEIKQTPQSPTPISTNQV